MLIDDLVMARYTIPCIGQILILFRTEASKTVYPVQNSEGIKTIPCPAASPRITQIREYSPRDAMEGSYT